MYPRFIDSGWKQANVNLTLNWKIPDQPQQAREACMAHPDRFNYTVDMTHQASMQWLRDRVLEQRAAEDSNEPFKPFFLYEAFTVPHAGGWGHAPGSPESGAPVPTDLQYANESWPTVEKDHAAVITYLDSLVGDLVAELDRLGVAEKTLVLFASDNGAHLEGGHDYHFFNSTGGLKGHKRSLYEGGVRSPTMARWPGTIKPGTRSDFAWAFWDVMPTFAELSGGHAAPGIDGVSIVPTLMGSSQPPKKYLYFTWDGTGVPPLGYSDTGVPQHGTWKGKGKESGNSGFGVRSGDWKGVVAHCTAANKQPSEADLATMEVYDLLADPFEDKDLSQTDQGKAQAKRMLKLVMQDGNSCGCYQC